MAHHKLVLDEDPGEDFSLIAIHCSEDAFKMAFMLNKHAMLRLQRKKDDVDLSHHGEIISFPIFEFENELNYIKFNLVANKYRLSTINKLEAGNLFSELPSEKVTTVHLLPEYKNVDYFLKIDSDYESMPIRILVSTINEIEQVISAYPIQNGQIKSKNNLIFD